MTNIVSNYVPVLICGLSLPLSLFLWLGNMTYSKLRLSNEFEESDVIPPTRWLFSTLMPLAMMIVALRRKSVNKSGAIFGLLMAFILSIANHCFFVCLAVFFFSSSKATRFRQHMKSKIEKDFKEGGQRNWLQALCNVGMGAQLAILYLIDCGSGERPLDFERDYRASWLSLAVMSAFACSNGDTWASELGTVLSNGDPFLLTTLKRVPRGTNGGVSLIGLFCSFLGGLLIGFSYFLSLHVTVLSTQLRSSPPQWPLIVFGGIAGFLGSLIDSFLGASLQYSGINKDGKIVETPNRGIKHISGLRILDNHSVNLISSIITAVTTPFIALKYWPER